MMLWYAMNGKFLTISMANCKRHQVWIPSAASLTPHPRNIAHLDVVQAINDPIQRAPAVTTTSVVDPISRQVTICGVQSLDWCFIDSM